MERSLAWRLGLSAGLIPLVIGLFVLDHHAGESAPVLFVLALLLSIRMAWELAQLLTVRNIRPRLVPCVAGCVLLLVAAWWPHLPNADVSFRSLELTAGAVAGVVLLLLAVEAWRFESPGGSMESLGANLLIVAYAGLLLVVTAQLRWAAGAQAGYLLLGSVVVTAKMGDIGAYTIGRLFGKRKMAPALSPGKTWAGFVGAIAGAVVGALLWLELATPQFDDNWTSPPVWASAIFGVVVGLSGLVGDLCESLIKRDVGKKDAAALLPGFGGLLDLMDSVLYAGPVALLLWHVLPLASWK